MDFFSSKEEKILLEERNMIVQRWKTQGKDCPVNIKINGSRWTNEWMVQGVRKLILKRIL